MNTFLQQLRSGPPQRIAFRTESLRRFISFTNSFRSLATMGVPAAHIEAKLKDKLACTHVELTDLSDGCGQKFAAVIVSPQFVGEMDGEFDSVFLRLLNGNYEEWNS